MPFYSWLLFGANTSVLFCLFGHRILNDFIPFSIFARGGDVTAAAVTPTVTYRYGGALSRET